MPVDEQVQTADQTADVDPDSPDLPADTAEMPSEADIEPGPGVDDAAAMPPPPVDGPPLDELDPEEHFVVDEPDFGVGDEVPSDDGGDRGGPGS